MNKISGTIKLVFGFIVGFSSLLSATGFASENDGAGWAYKTMDLEVTYSSENKKILVEGTATLILEAESSFGPTLALNLNATLNLRTQIVEYTKVSGGQGSDVDINVSPNDASHKNANATKLANIRYREAFKDGDEITITFAFESVGEGFQFKVSDQNMVMASYEAGWYPVPISGPNESKPRLKRAVGTMTFKMPAGVHAFTNGKLIRQTAGEKGVVEVWQLTKPMARSFAIGPYTYERFDLGGKEVAVYLLSDEARPVWTRGKVISSPELLDGLKSSIDILEGAYGPFPYESFGIVEISNDLVNWWGSLEEGFMTATSGSLSSGKIGVLGTTSHEIAHAWWGALVETEGPGAYLGTESLANFSTRYFFEKYMGVELSNHLFRYGGGGPIDFNYSVKGYFQQFRDGKDAPLSGLASGSGNNYNLASAKGGLMYDMLRRRIGDDDLFFGVFKDLVKEFGGKTLTLDDIRAAFVSTAPPGAKLERFFAQWLDGTGAPRLEATWQEISDTQMELTITQTHGGEPFNLFLDVDIYLNGLATRKSIEVDGRVTKIVLEKEGQVDDVVLDPDHVLLIWTSDYGPFPTRE